MTTATLSATGDLVKVCEVSERALRIWPGLDARSLSRCGCDPDRIAVFVATQTSLPIDTISRILLPIERVEPPFYFG